MRDRLGEIKRPDATPLAKSRVANESRGLYEEVSHPFFAEFFDTVEIVKNGCRNIELAATSIDSLNDATAASQENQILDSLDRVVEETNAKIALIQNLLRK